MMGTWLPETCKEYTSISGPIGCPETSVIATILHCITSQKSEDLIDIIVEACTHVRVIMIFFLAKYCGD